MISQDPPPVVPLDPDRLTDALGVALAPTTPDRARIVSFVPSLTELVCDLGLGSCLVGRTRYCVHPADALRAVPVFGGTKQLKRDAADALAAARPTHALLNIDENTPTMAAQLAALGAQPVVTHPLHPDDNLPLYALLGRLFDRDAAASSLSDRYRAARAHLAEVAHTLPPRRVLYLIWRNPWMTTSQHTYISQTLALARLSTAAHDPDTRYPTLGPDLDRPDLLDLDAWLLSSEPFPFSDADADALAASHPARASRVRCVDGEALSWYGSRAIHGLQYLAAFAASLPPPRA